MITRCMEGSVEREMVDSGAAVFSMSAPEIPIAKQLAERDFEHRVWRSDRARWTEYD